MSAPDRSALRALAAALALTLAAAAGCSGGGSSSPTAIDVPPEFGKNDPSIVVAVGDSITFGVLDQGVEICSEATRGLGGFCPKLQALTGKTVIDEGVCGAQSEDGVDRIAGVLTRWHPGVVLVDYGINDLFFPANSVIANLRAIVIAARANHTVPILGTLIPATGDYEWLNPSILAVNSAILRLCAEQRLECADHYSAFVNYPGFAQYPRTLLSEDGLHPNTAGYSLMARTWRWPLLRVY